MISPSKHADRIAGCLLGMAVGDALGLPREGLSRERATKLFGGPPLRHRLFFGRGFCSDETEHACMTSAALLRSDGSAPDFARRLAWQLRGWLATLPPGVGMATARACLKLCAGFPPERSGVHSAGNGPAMRSPILGACLADKPGLLRDFVRASTRMTHTDPRAEEGAWLLASAAAEAVLKGRDVRPAEFIERSLAAVRGEELANSLRAALEHLRRGDEPAPFAESLGLGRAVSGYINHTVPMAIYCWLRYPGDFRAAVEAAILLGGDADSMGAAVGALAGATAGRAGIPAEWLDGLWEWPRTPRYMEKLADALDERTDPDAIAGPMRPPRWCWPAALPRNLFALIIILGHGSRRLAPPY